MSDWITDFRETVEDAARRLRQLGEVESGQPPAEGEWSPKEIIGHLIDSAANNHARFVLAQTRDNLVFPGYDQNNWVAIQNYRAASWDLLVDLWRAYNLHLAHVMSCVPAEKLRNSCAQHTLEEIAWQKVSQREPVTLEYLMRDYVDHLKHHLGQMPLKRDRSAQ